MRKALLFVSLLYSILAAPYVIAAEKPEAAYARALFPESAAWRAIEQFPFPDELESPELVDELELLLKLSGDYGRAFCSDSEFPMQKLLEFGQPLNMTSRGCKDPSVSPNERASLGRFAKADLNGDGLSDIFYTGYSPCLEGTYSMIWFATPAGSYRIEKNSKIPGKIMLVQPVEPGQAPQFVTWSPGCCGDSRDTYAIGNVIDDASHTRYANNWMRDPAVFLPGFASGQTAGEKTRVIVPGLLLLRLSPKTDDEYDHGTSEAWDITSLGNIQSIYACNAIGPYLNSSASLLARSEDGEWGLLALDAEHGLAELFGIGYPEHVQLGWAHESQFRTIEKHERALSAAGIPLRGPSPSNKELHK